MRRLAAILALVGLATTPAVARTRLFCRYTGVEIVGCAEQDFPDQAQVRAADCCERRISQVLPRSNLTEPAANLPPPALFPLPGQALLAATRPPSRPRFLKPPPSAGPPLFVQLRSLLI